MSQYNDEEYDIEGDESMLLDEEMDDNYEPTDEEIVEYAQFLGMNLREDQDLLYIAKEGLKAPLPENFKPYKRRTGEIVYVNLKSNEFQEEHPCDEYYRNLYQEMKRKKVQPKTTGSKFKKNFPIAGNSPVSIKADPLPTVNLASGQKKNAPKGFGSLDRSNISDPQDTSNVQDTSFSGIPTPLINKDNKKKPPGGPPVGFSDSRGLSEQFETDPANGIEALDLEYGQKFLDYSQVQEDEITSLRKEYQLQREKTENKIRKDVERAMEELEEELNENLREKTDLMTREKEKLKVTLRKEYEDKIEEEIKKLDKNHFNNKKNIHKEQEDTVQNSIANEEISIEQEYKDKKQQLQNQKRDLESQLQQSKKDEESRKQRVHQEFDQEKESLQANFKKNLKEFSNTERENQDRDIASYKTQLQEKLKEEKEMLVNAKQQKQTLWIQRREELKEMYERKYKLETDKIDNENAENLREYEEKVKLQKDSEIQKIKNQEIKQNKDKKQTQLQNEISQLQDNYKKRLFNFEQVLREKYDKETKLIDNEVEMMLEKTKQEVENISLNVSNKKELLKEIEQVQKQETSVIIESRELEKKVLKQRDQNVEYQNKLEQMKENYKDIQRTSKQMIEDLKNEVQNTEKQIQALKSAPKVRLSSPPDQKESKKKIHAKIPHNLTLSKIMKELQEIKSFIITKEEKSYLQPHELKAPSKTFLGGSSIPFEKPSKTENESIFSKYQEELNHVQHSKQKLKSDKLTLKRVQEHLLDEQKKFRQEFDNFKLAENKSPQRKNNLLAKKEYLNEQVKTLNQDIHALQEREDFLKTREKALESLKPGKHEKHHSVTSHTLRDYQSLAYEDLQHLSKPKQATKGESEFYKRWDKVVENQMNIDVASESENNDVSNNNNTKIDYTQISKEFLSSKIDRSPSPVKTGFAYDYQNRIKMLDLKLRSGLVGSENDYARKQRNQSTEFRYKMNSVCTQQSQYLNSLKMQLNSQLYDRPQSSITASRFL